MPLSEEEIKKFKKQLRQKHEALLLKDEFFDVFFLACQAWMESNKYFTKIDEPLKESFFDNLKLTEKAARLRFSNTTAEISSTLSPLFQTTYETLDKEIEPLRQLKKIIPDESIEPVLKVEHEIVKSSLTLDDELDSEEAADNAGDLVEAADAVVESALSLSKHNINIKLAGGMHVVNLITSAFSVITIPALYLYQLARGQEPSFNLSNNAKWASGVVLLTLAIVALAVPGAAIAMLTAGAIFSVGVAVVSFLNVYRERKILKDGLDKLDSKMLALAKELNKLQDDAKALQNIKVTDLTPDNKSNLEKLNNDYSQTERQLKKLASKYHSIKTARDDLGTPFDIASYSAGIALAVGGVIAAGLLFSPLSVIVVGGIFTGLAVAAGVMVGVAVVRFVMDYRERKKAAAEVAKNPPKVEEVKLPDSINNQISFTATVLTSMHKENEIILDDLTHQGRLTAMAKRLATFVDKANQGNPQELIQFFVTFAENHKDNEKAAREIYEKLPSKLAKSAGQALEKAIAADTEETLKDLLAPLREEAHKELFTALNINLTPAPKPSIKERLKTMAKNPLGRTERR